MTSLNSKHIALGVFARKLRARKGPSIAIKAVARKIAEFYWRIMVKGLTFAEKGIKAYEAILFAQKQKSLARMAKELNVQITYNV